MKDIIKKITDYYNSLGIFKHIIWFLFLFISFDFLWKLAIDEGEHGAQLIFFGFDLTDYTYFICKWTADASYWVVHSLWGYSDFKIDDLVIYFPDRLRLLIVWGCTGVKQIIMFSFIICFCYGPRKQKLWYIPLAAVFLNLINVLRIALTAIIVKDGFPDWFIPFNEWYNNCEWDTSVKTYWKFYEDWFQLFHRDVFRWLYYDGVMFLLWLLWQEKFNLPFQKKRNIDAVQEPNSNETKKEEGND